MPSHSWRSTIQPLRTNWSRRDEKANSKLGSPRIQRLPKQQCYEGQDTWTTLGTAKFGHPHKEVLLSVVLLILLIVLLIVNEIVDIYIVL